MSLFARDKRMGKMEEKVIALELALKQISDAKKQLCRNTAEAKSRIQCNISRQLETLRNREVWLLNQLDTVSSAKEEVLQQQSARLHKSLGVLQSNARNPDTELLQIDVGDLLPEETPFVSFKADPANLREAIMSYGRIDSSSGPRVQSPFMAPDQQAPSLPRQFEDYHDAEHHILYKTVEEINRNKTEEPSVYVNIPKLSCRAEDWLLQPSQSSAVTATPTFSFPGSNNLSDWLKSPLPISSYQSNSMGFQDSLKAGMSADASIKTWLHKIKQNPFEEEEEDYDFVEDMSDTQSQFSEHNNLSERAPYAEWLYRGENSSKSVSNNLLISNSVPLEKWLLKSSGRQTEDVPVVDMSRYFNKISDELDKWLARASVNPSNMEEDEVEVLGLPRPVVPASLELAWSFGGHLSRLDNPWLLRSRSDTRGSSSVSPASSRRSSMSSVSSSQVCPGYSKWLLHKGQLSTASSTVMACPIMEKYKKEVEKISWLKSEQKSSSKDNNPLANFGKQLPENDFTVWLKSEKNKQNISEGISPLKNVIEQQKSAPLSDWLLKTSDPVMSRPTSFAVKVKEEDKKWLIDPANPSDSWRENDGIDIDDLSDLS